VALVDPSLTSTCPSGVARDCALDALAHSLEALWNQRCNPVSDALAVSAARGVLTTLPRLVGAKAGEAAVGDYEALSAAALNAGLAFSNTETALAHELSYRITIERGACARGRLSVCMT
jgi:alcohol dehydrogenase class IV